MSQSPQITKTEWRWAVGWSLVLLVLSAVPYLIAAYTAPEGWNFAGILVNPLDGHSYMAKMTQGAAGNWLFHLTYAPEPHAGAYIFLFYLGLGHLAALTGLSNILVFHLARLAAGFVLLPVAFKFICRITPQRSERRLAFVLVLFASGLGWLGAIFGAFPIDLWVPEAFVHYSLVANPHFPLAMALMLIIFGQVLDAQSGPKAMLWSGLAAFALALILPFALMTVWAVLAVFLAWRFFSDGRQLPWVQIWPTLVAIGAGLPVIFYQYWVSTRNPVLAGWGAQNITSAPRLLDFGLGYGLVGLLAVVGGWQILRKKENNSGEWLVLLWVITTVLLIYLPFNLQRRLINGLHLPLCILAAVGLTRWLATTRLKPHRKRMVTGLVVGVSALGTLFVWSLPLLATLQSPEENVTTALLFIRQDEATAFEWLQAHAGPDDVILASSRVGMFVPGQTGARSFYGHPFETIEAETKKAQLEAFYSSETNSVSPPADFVIYGPSEQALGQPQELLESTPVFSSGSVSVY